MKKLFYVDFLISRLFIPSRRFYSWTILSLTPSWILAGRRFLSYAFKLIRSWVIEKTCYRKQFVYLKSCGYVSNTGEHEERTSTVTEWRQIIVIKLNRSTPLSLRMAPGLFTVSEVTSRLKNWVPLNIPCHPELNSKPPFHTPQYRCHRAIPSNPDSLLAQP